MSIEVSNLSFNYGQRAALMQINFALAEGSFNALLGPNGAGKSTLFALLCHLYQLQQGQIRVCGLDISEHPQQVMQQLGVVFQHSSLDLDLTVQQNLEYHASLHGLNREAARNRMQQELERFHLTDRLPHKVRSLNGGHRRRVEIVRALLHSPKVLLLDEATAGLDPPTRQALNKHVRQLCQQQNITVLWASHLIEEIEPQDSVLLLHRGQLTHHDTGAAICQQGQHDSLSAAFEQLTGTAEALC